MLQKWAGYDPSERQIVARSAVSRFEPEQIETMVDLARSGASGVEIGRQLHVKPEAVRARLWRMGISLRKRAVARLQVRMVVPIGRAMSAEADRRGISVQTLVRRVLRAVVEGDWFDEILGRPFRSLGAAATCEPAAGRAGAAAVADATSSVAAATFAVVLVRTPQLGGCCARLG
jgi:hypothetical protein